MAKKVIKKRDTANPSATLVIFLVFFILLSIGLGVWGYYGYSGQDALRSDAKAAKEKAEASQKGEALATFGMYAAALGSGVGLEAKDLTAFSSGVDDFDGGKWNTDPTKPTVEKVFNELKKELGWDNTKKRFTSNVKDKFNQIKTERDSAQADLARERDNINKTNAKLLALTKLIDKNYKKAIDDINQGNKDILAKVEEKTQEVQALLNARDKFRAERDGLEDDLKKKTELWGLEKERFEKTIVRLKDALTGGVAVAGRDASEPHALLLDVSRGKALWDNPLGKIVHVDLRDRLVTINIGSQQKVKTQLTFNVFAPGATGRAEKELKGTIEVIRVVGPNSSVARITSLYDAEGREISLNDPVRGRIQRETEHPMREGDLIFNLAFDSHVIIAGNISFTGLPSETPTEQMRNLQSFMAMLERQGITVDAYLDLSDEKIKGEITNQTRYYIRGNSYVTKHKEGRELERAEKLNKAMDDLRKEAAERGMFIISADNFVNVIGFRRPGSADDLEVSGFRPTNPAAGAVHAVTPPPEEKKQ